MEERTILGELRQARCAKQSAGDVSMRLEALLSAETSGLRIALDLQDLMLVDQGVVIFLGRCEANGIEIENCPTYIREWMKQGKG